MMKDVLYVTEAEESALLRCCEVASRAGDTPILLGGRLVRFLGWKVEVIPDEKPMSGETI